MISTLSDKQIADLRWSNALFGSGVSPISNWYGIKGIKFIYLNDWCDPLIEYKGKRFSCYYVEDSMWEEWVHDDDGNVIPEREGDSDGFAEFMKQNADEVITLCEEIIEGAEQE